jgi:hypothetical protein
VNLDDLLEAMWLVQLVSQLHFARGACLREKVMGQKVGDAVERRENVFDAHRD